MQPYDYASLTAPDEVRLLVLAPGSGSEPLNCRLKHIRLSENVRYDALSYAWGNPSKPREIACKDSSLAITESLFTALRHLRRTDAEISIWVDAVCINQSSDKEKNHQLALMAEIYWYAERTVVWLGEDKTGCAAEAFRQISYLYSNVLGDGMTNEEIRRDVLIAYQNEGWDSFEAWYENFIVMIAPIFGSPYFYRLWVVQEFALGRNKQLVFGTATMLVHQLVCVLEDLIGLEQGSLFQERYNFHALCNLLDMDNIRSSYRGRLNTTAPRIRQPDSFPEILDLIRQTERQFFSDPRDRLYAILSLAETPGFSADYTSTVDETFMRFASWALASFPSLALLSTARGVFKTRFNLPSWALAPDMAGLDTVELLGPWDAPLRRANMPPNGLPMSFLHIVHFNASRMGSVQVEHKEDTYWSITAEQVLQLKGFMVDCVQTRGTRWLNTASSGDMHHALNEASEIAECEMLDYEDPRYKRFCAAMTFELNVKGMRALPVQHENFDRHIRGILQGVELEEEYDQAFWRRVFADMHSWWARYRYFSLTTSDRFAWVPYMAEAGDMIYVVKGSRVPYVLRIQPDGRFVLVGECWIQGLMEGEALDQPEFKWDDIFLI